MHSSVFLFHSVMYLREKAYFSRWKFEYNLHQGVESYPKRPVWVQVSIRLISLSWLSKHNEVCLLLGSEDNLHPHWPLQGKIGHTDLHAILEVQMKEKSESYVPGLRLNLRM